MVLPRPFQLWRGLEVISQTENALEAGTPSDRADSFEAPFSTVNNLEINIDECGRKERRHYDLAMFCRGLKPKPGQADWLATEFSPYKASRPRNILFVYAIYQDGKLFYFPGYAGKFRKFRNGGCAAALFAGFAAFIAGAISTLYFLGYDYGFLKVGLTTLGIFSGILALWHFSTIWRHNRFISRIEKTLSETYHYRALRPPPQQS